MQTVTWSSSSGNMTAVDIYSRDDSKANRLMMMFITRQYTDISFKTAKKRDLAKPIDTDGTVFGL